MSRKTIRWGWYLGLGMMIASWANAALAQITPDGTLPNNSTININGNIFDITGGTQRGNNLFHSFNEFSVRTGSEAHFNNAVDINNIISRVTGSSISNIDGLIKVLQGNANLFLLNPNGIVFGPNARLDIRGSFVGSTANSIKFADGFEFSAKNAQTTPLLTISVPLGLQFGANPQRIQVIGDGQGVRSFNDPIIDDKAALRVPENQTLALVGGDISLEGATLKTAGGRIELGSISGEGLVTFTPSNKGFSLGYATGQNLGNIELSQQAVVDASGAGGGDVLLTGRRVSLKGGSQIEASTLGLQPGGTLALNASELVEVSDLGSGLFVVVYPGATRAGGNLTVNTDTLLVRDGAQINASTFGEGNAGRIEIKARDTVSLSGQGRSYIGNDVGFGGVGDSGGISINTGSLFLSDKAVITSNVNGRGNSGGVEIVARDLVSLDNPDEPTLGGPGTLILSRVNDGAVGNGGDINIKTGSLRTSNSQITTSTSGEGNSGSVIIEARDQVALLRSSAIFTEVTCACETESGRGGDGKGGDIRIKTGSLFLDGGSNLRADTESRGNAGNIIIEARDSITFSGSSNQFTSGAFTQVEPEAVGRGGDIIITTGTLSLSGDQEINTRTQGQGDAGNISIKADSISLAGSNVRIISGASQQGRLAGTSGNGGDINITTDSLLITDSALLSANTEIRGSAGDITINASRLTLNNRGTIKSESVADADGGNITLNIRDFLLMRRNSQISATAGTAQAGGNGGNITIDAPNGFIVALPNENSDITADAFSGQGGNVRMRAANIFNITPLSRQELERLRPNDLNPRQLQTNDITAISQQNPTLSGQISINTPDVDPNRGFVELPTVLLDTSTQIDTSCAALANGEGNQFTVTGRGGLPPSPYEPLTTDVVWSDTRLPDTTAQQDREQTPSAKPTSKPETMAIVPATGWVFNGKGQVTLISHASSAASLGSSAASCPQR